MNRGHCTVITLAIILTGAPAVAQGPGAHLAAPSWSVLADLHPGTVVVLKAGAAEYWRRYVIAASDADLTVLNMTEPWTPPVVRETLGYLATYHPEYLLGHGSADFQHRNVRVTQDAVYVAGEKALDLSRAVQRFAREDVKEVRYAPRTTAGQGLGMLAGGLAGTIGAAVLGYKQFNHYKPAGSVLSATGGMFLGIVIGRGVGSLLDFHSKSDDVIYRR